jgi:hypothetical protein
MRKTVKFSMDVELSKNVCEEIEQQPLARLKSSKELNKTPLEALVRMKSTHTIKC